MPPIVNFQRASAVLAHFAMVRRPRRAASNVPRNALIQEFPGRRPVEMPHSHSGNGTGLEVAGVYAYPAVFVWLYRFPVRDTSACGAPDELEILLAPGVTHDHARLSTDRDVLELVIRPERAVATADRAVAACQTARLSWDIDADGAAVTGSGEHGLADDVDDANDQGNRLGAPTMTKDQSMNRRIRLNAKVTRRTPHAEDRRGARHQPREAISRGTD